MILQLRLHLRLLLSTLTDGLDFRVDILVMLLVLCEVAVKSEELLDFIQHRWCLLRSTGQQS